MFSIALLLNPERVYAQSNQSIQVVDEKILIAEKELRSGMQFNPDDSKLFYIKKDGIWFIDLEKPSREKILLNLTDSFVQDFRISPDGRQILWIKVTPLDDEKRTGPSSLLISNLETLNTVELFGFDYWALIGADWTPDGKAIVYQFGPDVWMVNSDGRDKRFITRIDNSAAPLELGPDGRTILVSAYSPSYPHEQNIIAATLDGMQKILMRGSSASDYWAPAWSPDGSKILFVQRNGLKDFDIMIAEPDGSDKAVLIPSLEDGSSVDISPDGHKIVYQKDKQIWIATLSQAIPEFPLAYIVLAASIIAMLLAKFRVNVWYFNHLRKNGQKCENKRE